MEAQPLYRKILNAGPVPDAKNCGSVRPSAQRGADDAVYLLRIAAMIAKETKDCCVLEQYEDRAVAAFYFRAVDLSKYSGMMLETLVRGSDESRIESIPPTPEGFTLRAVFLRRM